MLAHFIRSGLLPAVAACMVLRAAPDFSRDQLKLLKDPAGWDYVKMSDTGMQTEHPCFNGQPATDECRGRLILGADNHFVQEVTIHGKSVPRKGTYTLAGDQLTFVDELENKDGPYTVALDAKANALVISMPQVRIELELHKAAATPNTKGAQLSAEQITLLKDPVGWDYVKIVDDRQGINQTCSETPRRGAQCYGRLILGTHGSYFQLTQIHGQRTERRGTYTLENDQLTLVDDQGTQDGPYTIEIDVVTKALALSAPQLRTEFESHQARLDKNSKDAK